MQASVESEALFELVSITIKRVERYLKNPPVKPAPFILKELNSLLYIYTYARLVLDRMQAPTDQALFNLNLIAQDQCEGGDLLPYEKQAYKKFIVENNIRLGKASVS